MTVISITKGVADIINAITKELEQANKLKEAELRLKYGDNEYFKMMDKINRW